VPPSVAPANAPAFRGSDGRFEFRRALGSGGFGIVYEAFDRERGTEVAIKTLTRLDPAALYRFKREFRGLVGCKHQNLVELHELANDGRDWLLVMELVRGGDCLSWMRHGLRRIGPEAATISKPPPGATSRAITLPPPPAADPARIRHALSQLVAGLSALHGLGRLHRDVKPSNVLVENATERVVLVDFGIATELRDHRARPSEIGPMPGTPEYMAPEQAAGAALGEAVDWYAVGVLLYEALTGTLPFVGPPLQILVEKQRTMPRPPREIAPDAPADLAALALDLLQTDPAARPSAQEILARLALPLPRLSQRPVTGPQPTLVGARTPLIGRSRELGILEAAYERVQEGAPTVVLVSGPSGIGKSALVETFLDDLARDAIVLSGRCYERESVPYKALDGAIDDLSRVLLAMKPSEASAVVPRDVAALVRLFPVLQRAAAIAEAPRRPIGRVDPQQLRRRGFLALRELLIRLADRRPVVLHVDDLQWGDADSAALLAELAAPPDAPTILLIASFRADHERSEPPLRFVAPERGTSFDVRRIHLGPLGATPARALATALLAGDSDPRAIDEIVEEAAGNPLLVREICEHLGAEPSVRGERRFERILRERLLQFPPDARLLLDVVAVAGRPLRIDVAFAATGLDERGRHEALSQLRIGRIVRASGTRATDTIEPWHDRIRELVVSDLHPEILRARHEALARAIRQVGGGDPEALFVHSNAAGNHALAIEYAELAAARAEAALAFDRAAEFHRAALDLLARVANGERDAERLGLEERLADALAYAGRSAEAAEIYLAIAPRLGGLREIEVRRRAAEQFLVSGHVLRGLTEIRDVLSRLSLPLSKTPLGAVIACLVLRLWISIRGYCTSTRDASIISPNVLARIDVAWSLAAGLAAVDSVRAAHFQARNVLLCLRAGEPSRLVRALVLEATFQAVRGTRRHDAAIAIIDRARSLARAHPSAEAEALIELAVGSTGYFTGRWALATEAGDRFLAHYRDGLPRLQWELRSVQYFGLSAYLYRGDLATVGARLQVYLREAQERGDLYFGTNLYVGETNLWWLIEDDPDGARRVATAAIERWSISTSVQQWYALQAAVQADLYTGDLDGLVERVDERIRDLRRRFLLMVQHSRVKIVWLRARTAIASAAPLDRAPLRGARGESLLRRALGDARRLERERAPWATALAIAVRAGVAAASGDEATAETYLERADVAFRAADMALHAACARAVSTVPARAKEGIAWLAERGVRDPQRFARMIVPGFGASTLRR
jgi:serine/threonine protein kinase